MPNDTVSVEIVDGPTIAVPWTQNMSGQAAIEAAWQSINDSKAFSYGLQYYGTGLGYLVFMIDNTFDTFSSQSAPYFYWQIRVNGTPATKGVDGIVLESGDTLSFSFETYNAQVHAGTLVDAKHQFTIARYRS